ncbi:MAG: CPBP family intramembrane metalloprotease [Treponema sp.]|jgi:membrane protease YdiL (CAAX protease family)|nr:CPBP family intramembrane metalloprotease [Treponema sp.]
MEIKAYPGIKNALLLCLLFSGIQLLLGIITGLIIGLFAIGTVSTFYGIATILTQLVSFGTVMLIGIKKSKKKFNEIFKFNKVSLRLWLAIVVVSIGITIILSEIDNIFNYFFPMPEFLQDTFTLMMVEQTFTISIILVGIIPAFMEEMFFRGILLNGFNENYSERKAIIISALLFGMAHLNPWQFLPAFIIGIFSAWICIKTKSILLSMYIHGFNNILAVMLLKYSEAIPIKGLNGYLTPEVEFMPKWLDGIGILFFIAGMILLNNGIKSKKQRLF